MQTTNSLKYDGSSYCPQDKAPVPQVLGGSASTSLKDSYSSRACRSHRGPKAEASPSPSEEWAAFFFPAKTSIHGPKDNKASSSNDSATPVLKDFVFALEGPMGPVMA